MTTTSPPTRRWRSSARRCARDGVGPRAGADQRLRGLRRRAASTSAPRCCSARPSRRRAGAPRPRLRVRRDRARHRRGGAGGAWSRAVDVNERAVLLANENAAALGVADRFTADHARTRCRRTRPTTRSGRTRRSGSARRRCTTCCCTWLPRLAPGGRAVLVVGKNLGADSLQRWLGEQGYPTDAAGQRQGVPGARGSPGLTGRR